MHHASSGAHAGLGGWPRTGAALSRPLSCGCCATRGRVARSLGVNESATIAAHHGADQSRDGTQHTMSYDLAAAAAATGLNKASILRAIKSGKISGTKDALGQWWVEPAELHRVAEAPARAHGRLVPDKIYPGMWRVVGPSGTLSDIVNETRAKDVAWCLAESMVSTGTLAA